MIKLSRLDRQEIALNCDLFMWVEACPDTTVKLVGGESILVRESVDEVIRRITAFRSQVLREAGLPALLSVDLPAPALPRERTEEPEAVVVIFDREPITVVEVAP
ncbi:MAG: flagellar FlbD family protein [Candidatus Rokubacteria bacterium]|nr:flagellar FlbD family protein [Candidatus Rokubacteria bacterium]